MPLCFRRLFLKMIFYMYLNHNFAGLLLKLYYLKFHTFYHIFFRTVYFKYEKETSVRDIDTYRFWVPDDYFESAVKNPKNRCYCLETNDALVNESCKTNGVLDISNCALMGKGAPVVMSAPYFLHGDKELRDKINLRNPKELINENYGTFLDIEPVNTIQIIKSLFFMTKHQFSYF